MNAPLAALVFGLGLMVGVIIGTFAVAFCIAAARNENSR